MARTAKRPVHEFDVFEFSYGPDFDIELFDDTCHGGPEEARCGSYPAGRIERKSEYASMDQLLHNSEDWDDYSGDR